ncbi:Mov34/MPN/PAD-1 family protein [Microbacterium oxydans]|nr:Mov34/MPN/PAD-1 family protein [Microbacterium oxydans]
MTPRSSFSTPVGRVRTHSEHPPDSIETCATRSVPADYAWHVDGSQWVGEWHTHPTGPMTPSDRDLASYYAHLSDAELGFDSSCV